MRRHPLQLALSLAAVALIGLWACFLLGLSAAGHGANPGHRPYLLDVMYTVTTTVATHTHVTAPIDMGNATAGLRG